MDEKSSQQPQSDRKLWFFFTFAIITAILVAAVRWSLEHPYGIHWDEAQYLDDILIDGQRFRTGHILKLAGRILVKNLGRPPAYRLLAFPFIGVFGYHTTEARLVSLTCFALSAFFVFLATRRISTPAAGALAALVFALSPEVVSASIFFGTDTALYLATAAMLFYIFTAWSDGGQRTGTWIGLGCAVGLGFLAKTSFVLIALPVLAFWFAASHWKGLKIPSLTSQRKAGALAFLIAAPWWFLNVKDAIAYGQYARGFVANSLGPPSLATWMRWLDTVFQCLLGVGLSILIGLVLLALVAKLIKKQLILSGLQKAAIGACACAGLPIVAAQLSGTNHLLRHITPSVIPLAIVVGVFASVSGWMNSRITTVVSLMLLCAQAVVLVAPVVRPNREPLYLGFPNGALASRTMIRFDQWDWRPAMNLADSCRVEVPEISTLGGGRAFNPPQIQFPWVVRTTATRDAKLSIPNVTWLWRFESGAPDWQKVMTAADQSDMVITAPQYTGEVKDEDDPDDRYNAEFEERLLTDPHFQGPFVFQAGRFAPVKVAIFMKKSLPCPPAIDYDGSGL
jgi:4-amino-4-deoxy-L-arabinose transferase-like glycosyltransferase